jgi:hypothetical protein
VRGRESPSRGVDLPLKRLRLRHTGGVSCLKTLKGFESNTRQVGGVEARPDEVDPSPPAFPRWRFEKIGVERALSNKPEV